ncbi:MAG: hypothetical protein KAU41_05375 [Deltaproteobacteria bacterium]|nr:hypothetical protein [Deltaproteobacteria bacterium]
MYNRLIIPLVLSLFLFFPMTINAATGIIDDTDTNKPVAIDFNVSKNVTVTYNVATNLDGYTTISSHKQGENLYGAGSDSTLVFRDSGGKEKGEVYTTVPTADNATAEFGIVGTPVGDWLPM